MLLDGVRVDLAHLDAPLPDWCEVWLTVADGPSFTMLLKSTRAFVMFLARPGDAGQTVRSDIRDADSFMLSNGQVDTYPGEMTLWRNKALDAARYFRDYLAPDPTLTWVAD